MRDRAHAVSVKEQSPARLSGRSGCVDAGGVLKIEVFHDFPDRGLLASRWVNADHHDVARVLLVQGAERWQVVAAGAAPFGPEVENHHLAGETGELQRRAVEPARPGREGGRGQPDQRRLLPVVVLIALARVFPSAMIFAHSSGGMIALCRYRSGGSCVWSLTHAPSLKATVKSASGKGSLTVASMIFTVRISSGNGLPSPPAAKMTAVVVMGSQHPGTSSFSSSSVNSKQGSMSWCIACPLARVSAKTLLLAFESALPNPLETAVSQTDEQRRPGWLMIDDVASSPMEISLSAIVKVVGFTRRPDGFCGILVVHPPELVRPGAERGKV